MNGKEPPRAREPGAAPRDGLPPILGGRIARAVGRAFLERGESSLWRIPSLNIAFAVLSAGLLVVTLAAIGKDHAREWKAYQAEWRKVRSEDLLPRVAAEEGRAAKEGLGDLERKLGELEGRLSEDGGYRDLRRAAARAAGEADLAEREARRHAAKVEARRSEVEVERRRILSGGDPGTARERLREVEEDFREAWVRPGEDLQERAEGLRASAAGLLVEEKRREAERDDIRARIAALTRDRDALRARLRDFRGGNFEALRALPLVPPLDPSNRIEKVVIEDLPVDLNFALAPRVDRCKTCHLGIDEGDPRLAGFTDPRSIHGGRLFRSHPRLDLFAGPGSPHPYDRFGCTICHGGEGRGTSFASAGHTPRDAGQRREWETRYGWREPDRPGSGMLPIGFTEAACARCHPLERIAGADRWNAGRDRIERSGCPGCHRMEGLEGRKRIGPDLAKVVQKVRPGFIVRWLEDPARFRPSTRMPRFFHLSNSRGIASATDGRGGIEDLDLRSDVEAMALARLLEGRPEDRPPVGPNPRGDPARGKEVVKRIGCLGCHSILREGFAANDLAPDLSSIGSKVRPEWLASWIADPRRHDPASRMPRLRIEEGPGDAGDLADAVAYLAGLRDAAFEGLGAPALDGRRRKALEDIVGSSVGAGRSAASRGEIEALSADELLLQAGRRVAARSGCNGCHPGLGDDLDRTPRIGPDLTLEGSKAVEQFDFARWGDQGGGRRAIGRSRIEWLRAKIGDPRIFDTLPVEAIAWVGNVEDLEISGAEARAPEGSSSWRPSGELLLKAPGTRLRMPLFTFRKIGDDPASEETLRWGRIDEVVAFVQSRLGGLARIRKLGPEEEDIEAGRNLIRSLNCRGCHRIGADPREAALDDLPSWSYDAPDDARAEAEFEKETWLAADFRAGRMTIPRGTFLSSHIPDRNDPDSRETAPVREVAARAMEAAGVPAGERRIPVLGLGEGKVRLYLGPGADARPRAPPLLRKEGDRVRGAWLHRFILDPVTIRPWLEIRMPSYPLAPAEAEALVRWFKLTSGAPYPPLAVREEDARALARWFPVPPGLPPSPVDLGPDGAAALSRWMAADGRPPHPYEIFPEDARGPETDALAERGRSLFEVATPGDPSPGRRLQCNTCHPAGKVRAAVQDRNSQGPDFAMARERLRPPWIRRWLLDPQASIPDTRMPRHFTSFDDPFEPLNVLRPAYAEEIESLVHFLMRAGGD